MALEALTRRRQPLGPDLHLVLGAQPVERRERQLARHEHARHQAGAATSSSTARAASRPGAPLTAPPGWAPEPAR